MEPARLRLIVPAEPATVDRLAAVLAEQSAPRISVARDGSAVLALECATGQMMLRSRVMQALEDIYGPDWPRLVETSDR